MFARFKSHFQRPRWRPAHPDFIIESPLADLADFSEALKVYVETKGGALPLSKETYQNLASAAVKNLAYTSMQIEPPLDINS